MAKTFAGQHYGYNIFLLGCSYECPQLKLFGYATQRAIKNAIARKVKAGKSPAALIAAEYRANH